MRSVDVLPDGTTRRDLDHEEGRHQHQRIDEEAEETDRKEAAFTSFEGSLQIIFGL